MTSTLLHLRRVCVVQTALLPLHRVVLLLKDDYALTAVRGALSTLGGTIFALFDQSLRQASIRMRARMTALRQRLAAGMGEEA
jgi:hypothetical protein